MYNDILKSTLEVGFAVIDEVTTDKYKLFTESSIFSTKAIRNEKQCHLECNYIKQQYHLKKHNILILRTPLLAPWKYTKILFQSMN